MNIPHTPVLLNEVLESFSDIDNGYFVDCTLGYAGHSEAILHRYPDIKLVGIDQDYEALSFSSERLKPYSDRSRLYRGRFSKLLPTIEESPIVGLLADFGVSSLQLDKLERGFGFDSDTLDMRMDSDSSLSAYEVVNEYSREKLEYILHNYGEVKRYKQLAGAIVEARAKKPISSAKELSQIAIDIEYRGKIHPATLMFQGIRIEVNDELGEIERLLDVLEDMRPSNATIALITFHSLEDRLVKNRFRDWAKSCICDPHAIRCTCGKNHSLGKIVTRKPLTATKEELKTNPRSRSAKLRVFRFDR
ncbi:rRNA small subunit methyltransferase H [hydrothermal vent metagenome]|uniref:rRNA small subunit methyltransferase H n=1 Tax=hydrothermal vent metagenome TaxID=652676 RepID=A0A1W1B995_9ZZZZ